MQLAARLFELLPLSTNQLRQTNIAWAHVSGFGYRYMVTVIDYYSRYMLDFHSSGSHAAGYAQQVLGLACRKAERVYGSPRRISTGYLTMNQILCRGRFGTA